MTWLQKRNLTSADIASLFGTTPVNVRQIIWRHAHRKSAVVTALLEPVLVSGPLAGVPASVRQLLGIRPHEDSVVLDASGRRRLDQLEEEVEQAASVFWSGVRHGTGLLQLSALLPKVGYISHHRRIRLKARIHQLICETNLHWGRSASAINEGLASLHLFRIAGEESGQLDDFNWLGRSARLISQAYLLRQEPAMARRFLEVHRVCCEAAGVGVRPEYFHQLAIAALQDGAADERIPTHLRTAMHRLSETEDNGRPRPEHEVRDIGERALNLLHHDWDRSCELLEAAKRHYPPHDLHITLNALWTAASGFGTDDMAIHGAADNMLSGYVQAVEGYLRQNTILMLLRKTVELPRGLRADWSRHVLYENAFGNS